jgi:hypothetical protein
VGFELLAMGMIVDPFARCRNPLACRDDGGVTNDRNKITMAAGLNPDNAKAILGIVVSDTLDQSGQHVAIGWRGLNFHGAGHTLGYFFSKPGLPTENLLIRASQG